MMMEQDAKRVGRQAPEPQPEPGKDDGTNLFLGRIENPIQLQSCLGEKFEEIERKAPLNERMSIDRNKKDYVITYQLYGLNTGQPTVALKGNQGQSYNLLSMPQPIQLNLKNVRDEDKLNETRVGKYVVSDLFDLRTRGLKERLKLKKGNPKTITRK